MTEGIECAACSGRNLQHVEQWRVSGKQHKAIACQDCGLLFVHPQPSPEMLNEYYAPEGGWQASRTEKSPKSPQTRTKGAAPAMLAALDPYFAASRPAAGASVFDFGCGPGTWLNSFQDYGWETFGLEPCSHDAFVRHKRLTDIPAEPQFDLVLAYHVLEHLPRPLDTLRQLAQAIRPNGHCFISVPRIDTLAVHRQIDYCLHPRHHIVGFTETCLRGLLARAGLEVLATFHDLDERFSKGVPVRMRLLARKTALPVPVEPNAASALKPVIEAFVAIHQGQKKKKAEQRNAPV